MKFKIITLCLLLYVFQFANSSTMGMIDAINQRLQNVEQENRVLKDRIIDLEKKVELMSTSPVYVAMQQNQPTPEEIDTQHGKLVKCKSIELEEDTPASYKEIWKVPHLYNILNFLSLKEIVRMAKLSTGFHQLVDEDQMKNILCALRSRIVVNEMFSNEHVDRQFKHKLLIEGIEKFRHRPNEIVEENWVKYMKGYETFEETTFLRFKLLRDYFFPNDKEITKIILKPATDTVGKITFQSHKGSSGCYLNGSDSTLEPHYHTEITSPMEFTKNEDGSCRITYHHLGFRPTGPPDYVYYEGTYHMDFDQEQAFDVSILLNLEENLISFVKTSNNKPYVIQTPHGEHEMTIVNPTSITRRMKRGKDNFYFENVSENVTTGEIL